MMRTGGEVRMKDIADMSVKEMCELARTNQVQIELRVEPNGYGGNSTTFTIHVTADP